MSAPLFANLAAIALAVLAWNAVHHWIKGWHPFARQALLGSLMAAAAIANMNMAVPIAEGIRFDLRSTALALAAWSGGPTAAAFAMLPTIFYRAVLGGQGAIYGIVAAAGLTAVCLLLHYVVPPGRRILSRAAVVAFAVADVFLITLLVVPGSSLGSYILTFGLVVGGLTFAATFMGAAVLQLGQRLSAERELLRAALRHSPDYVYVKDTELRFVSVNINVAQLHGFKDPRDAYGKTDRDVDDLDHARMLSIEEREILSSGAAMTGRLEEIHTDNGLRSYITSKLPVNDLDGRLIGLVGVTRDVTEERALQAELAAGRERLSVMLSEMSDGVALFSASGVLQFCNDQYRRLFPRTAALRVPGAQLKDILRASAESGEQLGITPDLLDHWIDAVLDGLGVEGEQVIENCDGRWLRLRTRPIGHGESLVHVTDITDDKVSQKTLLNLAEQLHDLARTDPLTGLANRRAFDVKFEEELRRSARQDAPLSLILIDADHFKAFNDTYGHQRGDECLKAIAACIQGVSRRPGDLPARIGGEEFAVVLPDTDDDGAYQVAERLRSTLERAAIPHSGNTGGVVTASLGVATFRSGERDRLAIELIRRADEALYQAKGAGRNRVMGWRPRFDVQGKRLA